MTGHRYMYGETLGRWRTADLLIGLAYLARREQQEHPVADIARHGRPLGTGPDAPPMDSILVSWQDGLQIITVSLVWPGGGSDYLGIICTG